MLPRGVKRFFRLDVTRRGASAADADDEIRAHLEMRIERLMSRGLTREEATAEALRRFGAIAPARRTIANARRRTRVRMDLRELAESLADDVRFALRQL